jgi:hypothetical protein
VATHPVAAELEVVGREREVSALRGGESLSRPVLRDLGEEVEGSKKRRGFTWLRTHGATLRSAAV